MTTRDHLIYILQEVYSFHRDVLPVLDSLRHMSADARVRSVLQTTVDGIRGELETTERALNLISARYKMEHSALGVGIKEASDRFRHQISPSRAELDVHALQVAVTAAAIARSKYLGATEMARAIGEQDLVKLLEEMDQREVIGMADNAELAPQLIQEINAGEERRAA